ncbi:hypothetical protein T07_6552 [Trichinella nelsoni]|uniref:Uncharacterized protein n=1 Tax=Trichinella nelsoni TaxID=6336 RepID=A0A0V0RCS3_9BILA|nr:hypothetical protein T07_6552 [Trichinella nelsoni]
MGYRLGYFCENLFMLIKERVVEEMGSKFAYCLFKYFGYS